jgi:hypothetical protein
MTGATGAMLRIADQSGRLLSQTIQTQMVLT